MTSRRHCIAPPLHRVLDMPFNLDDAIDVVRAIYVLGVKRDGNQACGELRLGECYRTVFKR